MVETRSTRLFWCLTFGLLLFAFAAMAFAQTATLTGKVTDAETGDALPGANVAVTSGTAQTGAATSSDGAFQVMNIRPGTYVVRVTYIGYEAYSMAEVLMSAGETKTMDVALNPTGIEVNPISISASRRPEKVLDAPASVTVLDAREISTRPVLTAVEHLKATPGVDIVSTGMNQANVVVRGFNNIFSGALMSLVDNRISRVPGLRVNAYNFIPTANEDIERVEVVLGPGSALYGPNASSGVFHIVTKSPIGSEGTTVSVGGGERDLFMGSFRHAGSTSEKFGYKLSMQYYQANDWDTWGAVDPRDEEADEIQRVRSSPDGDVPVGGLVSNARDFDIEKIAGDIRFDFRPNDDFSAIFSGGFNQANSTELTGIGAGQAVDWTYGYAQARFTYKSWFAQTFVNFSDAGDTFLYQSGRFIIDKSKLIVGQLQGSSDLGDRQLFTYGFDALLTRPDTEGTVNGRNEDSDNIDEFGLYLQSETDLTSKLRFVGAIRADNHSELEDLIFSPRAAFVFKPNATNTLRFTYNRAFSTPTALNLSLDLLQSPDAFGTGAAFSPAFGFSPSFDVRAQGVPQSGFNFRTGPNGNPMFRSPFAPVAGLQTSDFIPLNDPGFTNVMWSVGSGAVSTAFVPQYVAGLIAGGLPAAQAQALGQQLVSIIPAGVSGVNNVMRTLDPETRTFFEDSPFDVARMKEQTTQTLELGYKGIIGEKLVVSVDGYYTQIKDFISPLLIVTPNVFLDPATLAASLGPQFGAALLNPANALLNATLVAALDDPASGGNGDGSAIEELTALYIAGTAQNGAAFIPFGTVSPEEATDPNALIATYRNFGDVDFFGLDFSFSYYVNRNWTLGGSYSFVSEDQFDNLDGIDDIALNSSKHKVGASLKYRNTQAGFSSDLRLRFVDSFPVISADFKGTSDRFAVLDLSANYKLPFSPNTNLNLTIQNLTNNEHTEIVGAPEIGRLGMLRLTQTF